MDWGIIAPLAGGMGIGCEQAFGSLPRWVLSLDETQDNDENYLNWLKQESDFGWKNQVGKYTDAIATVCPCAGLSMLNAGGHVDPKKGRGAGAIQNEHLYATATMALLKKPFVFFGENSPKLFTDLGRPVADRLAEIAHKHGYSFSMVRTNTNLHGIPQNRQRTFYFMWDLPSAPYLEWQRRPNPGLREYLAMVHPKPSWEECRAKHDLLKKRYCYRFMKEQFGERWREEIYTKLSCRYSVLEYVQHEGFVDALYDFVLSIRDDAGIRIVGNLMSKKGEGKNIWDSSIKVFPPDGDIYAMVSRNLADCVHPVEDRFLTDREVIHLMGHPWHYNLVGGINEITQNVPVTTAYDWAKETEQVFLGHRQKSGHKYLLQDNERQTITHRTLKAEPDSDFIESC